MLGHLRGHWPEYLAEGCGLGLFMVAAALAASALELPSSPVRHAVQSPLLRRGLMGLAMGGTAAALVYSPRGRRSGAHINPAVTLVFWRLSKVASWDAAFYVVSQFTGGLAGLAFAGAVLGGRLSDPAVNFALTQPGGARVWQAFAAEMAMSFVLMGSVLVVSTQPGLSRFTGLVVAGLLVLFISVEAPVSGMSLNPARSFASAASAWQWEGFWVYFGAPVLGMMGAAELYVRARGTHRVLCAKLHHDSPRRCIFRCGYRKGEGAPAHA